LGEHCEQEDVDEDGLTNTGSKSNLQTGEIAAITVGVSSGESCYI
jgi:hypothetical protein